MIRLWYWEKRVRGKLLVSPKFAKERESGRRRREEGEKKRISRDGFFSRCGSLSLFSSFQLLLVWWFDVILNY